MNLTTSSALSANHDPAPQILATQAMWVDIWVDIQRYDLYSSVEMYSLCQLPLYPCTAPGADTLRSPTPWSAHSNPASGALVGAPARTPAAGHLGRPHSRRPGSSACALCPSDCTPPVAALSPGYRVPRPPHVHAALAPRTRLRPGTVHLERASAAPSQGCRHRHRCAPRPTRAAPPEGSPGARDSTTLQRAAPLWERDETTQGATGTWVATCSRRVCRWPSQRHTHSSVASI
jgi:hypothetical protein